MGIYNDTKQLHIHRKVTKSENDGRYIDSFEDINSISNSITNNIKLLFNKVSTVRKQNCDNEMYVTCSIAEIDEFCRKFINCDNLECQRSYILRNEKVECHRASSYS